MTAPGRGARNGGRRWYFSNGAGLTTTPQRRGQAMDRAHGTKSGSGLYLHDDPIGNVL